MEDLVKILRELPIRIVASVITGAVVAGVAMLSKTFRQALLYKRHEFVLEYDSDFLGCEWDIQWEGLRLTFNVGNVHNEHLERVVVKRNEANPGEPFDVINVGQNYEIKGRPPIHFRVDSIIRTRPEAGVREYKIFLTIRRPRRWGLGGS